MAPGRRPAQGAMLLVALVVMSTALLGLTRPAAAAAAAAPRRRVRGVAPELAARYAPSKDGTWQCLDGSRVLPSFTRVNDDFCDCPDGSDEPGTSACPGGKFFCANRGHEGRTLSAAFVDDGVCDCCDGTDEPAGACPNKCLEASAAKRAALAKRVSDYKHALERRNEAADAAGEKRKEMAERLAAVGGEIEQAAAEVTAAEAEHASADAAAQKAREERRRKQEEEEQKKQEQKGGDEAAAAGVAAEPAAAAAEGEGGEKKEETDEERGRRIASQWTSDPAAAAAAAAGASGKKDAAGSSGTTAPPGGGDGAAAAAVTTAGGSSGGLFSRLRRAVESAVGGSGSSSSSSDPSAATANKKRPLTTSASEEHDWDDGVDDPFAGSALASNPSTTTAEAAAAANPEETAAAAAAAHLDAARERLRDLERERDLLNRQSTYDFGPDDAWLPLAGECAETLGGHFTYRVCLFDAAHQVDGSGAETSLGKWQGIEVGDAHQGAEAVFSGGDWCQNGPARSLRAKLVCGSDFEVSGASEPATCVYSATVTLPQACTAAGLEQLEEAVRELDAEQARLAEEIAADEAARRAEAEAEAAGAGGGGSGAHDEL